MSKIEGLLKNEKVEWKKLGEVALISKGKQFNKRDMFPEGKYILLKNFVSFVRTDLIMDGMK